MNHTRFIPRWTFSTGLLAFVLAMNLATAMSQDIAVAKTGPAKWYRHIFQFQKPTEFETSIGISLPATCRVWLNGQRLKRQPAEGRPVVFDVSRLIRSGANCLAVEHQTAATELPVALLRNGQPMTLAKWRVRTSEPPVGWQKTDFNDKNWQAVKPDQTTMPWAGVPVQSWASKATDSRFQNGQFRFRDNDHVALLGGTFFERAQQFGHLEAALMSSEANGLTFRNLGWSADTVFADSRGIFDTPAKGYARMIEHLRAEEPDVVIMAYGQNEAMQGDTAASDTEGEAAGNTVTGEAAAGEAARFQQQYQRLISDVRTTGAEVVLVTPHPFLTPMAPLPDAARWNPAFKRYSSLIQKLAGQTGCHCVNLFDRFEDRLVKAAETVGFWPHGMQAEEHGELRTVLLHSLTDNGMHWNDRGYRCVSLLFAESLFGPPPVKSADQPPSDFIRWNVASDAKQLSGAQLKAVALRLQHPWLKPGVLVVDTGGNPESIVSCRSVLGDKRVKLVKLPSGESSAVCRFQLSWQYDELLQLLVKKNELYFHRWRPQNITYLFGFRKHEQGNNASDIAKFDPLIVELERQIQTLRNSDGPTIQMELK